jgi:hypothetical protein
MAPLGNGEFALIWKNQPAVDDNIYGQKINLQGQLMWPDPFVVIDDSATTAAPQLNPRIVATSDHGVIVVWEDFRLDNQNPDLFAQKISNSGSLLWAAGGVNIADAPFGQYSPAWLPITTAVPIWFGMTPVTEMLPTMTFMPSISMVAVLLFGLPVVLQYALLLTSNPAL